MKVIILAGGLGSRLSEETDLKPKPMVEIGGKPILWHIMSMYAHYGYTDFGIALGYKGDVIKDYFLHYHYINNDLTVELGSPEVDVHIKSKENWSIYLTDTGLHTATGGRLKRMASWIGNETFMMTYGDGVSDINISHLMRFHCAHSKLATVTAVQPRDRYGELILSDKDDVISFAEKPLISNSMVSGGFFVLQPEVLDYIKDDSCEFEKDVLSQLAKDNQLIAYRHTGFWQCMDTLRDKRLLESLCEKGVPPWLQ